MPFSNMSFELAGELSLPMPLAQIKINEALGSIYDSQMWSWQLAEAGWLTPGLLFASNNQSVGTITTAAYNNQIIGNAAASAAWAAYASMPLLTQLQIRVPYYSLYNIVAYDTTTNPPFGTFTLDRPWMEPSGVAQAYMIYQAYFPAPASDFKRFFEIRDTSNNSPMDYWSMSRVDLSIVDAQRTVFNQPSFVVPYEVDNRPGSATLGTMLYELWGHPLSVLPYTISYQRRGNLLSLPSDTVPAPLTEDMVKWKAREASYLFKESQKGDGVKRGDGADWKFLAGAAAAEYEKCRKRIADRDRDLCELYFRRFVRDASAWSTGEPFANINGGLNVGRF